MRTVARMETPSQRHFMTEIRWLRVSVFMSSLCLSGEALSIVDYLFGKNFDILGLKIVTFLVRLFGERRPTNPRMLWKSRFPMPSFKSFAAMPESLTGSMGAGCPT
jgi:hypothetical protein